jgi:uncharacterized protein YpuA (DUF1002 family)
VVLGGDLTDADRQELESLLGPSPGASHTTVSRQELVDTLRAQNIPVSTTDQAISSAYLVCLGPGAGLSVQTHNITGVPAPLYAGALLIAGVTDASITIAAPAAKPVSGEAALVGVLKASAACVPGGRLDPNRTSLAYNQLTVTASLASSSQTDLVHASAVMLDVLHRVVTGQATDDAAISSALQTAADQQGLTLAASQRADVLHLMQQLHNLAYGQYARGYQIQELAPDQVRVVPTAGAG